MRREDYLLMECAGEYVVVPTGEAGETLHGIIRLNETGKVVWEALLDGLDEDAAAERLTAEYDVDKATALRDVRKIAADLRAAKIPIH